MPCSSVFCYFVVFTPLVMDHLKVMVVGIALFVSFMGRASGAARNFKWHLGLLGAISTATQTSPIYDRVTFIAYCHCSPAPAMIYWLYRKLVSRMIQQSLYLAQHMTAPPTSQACVLQFQLSQQHQKVEKKTHTSKFVYYIVLFYLQQS